MGIVSVAPGALAGYLGGRADTLIMAVMDDGCKFMESAPHTVIFPGIAISLTVLGFNLLGDGLRDVLDPRLKNLL